MPEQPTAEPVRVRNRWGEGERLRGEILEAASRLLSSLGGEDALTIRGIAREVGIAAPSIYQHFSDRAALVSALREHEYQRLQARMRESADALPEDDVVGRVQAQLRGYCEYAVDNPGHYRLMITHGESRVEHFWDVISQVKDGFSACEQAGHRLRLESERAAVTVVVGVHGRVALEHSSETKRGHESLTRFVDDLVSLVFA
ncbi:MAG: TetR/AcrR family transcriptional regulator [Nocardioides sp.]|nr:TetR/AcrR family transcriptional regulator [Nocardioides sp.]